MEVKINREIRNYTESMFFGLSFRQFVFSLVAIAVAVALYFVLKPYVGTETVSWIRDSGILNDDTGLHQNRNFEQPRAFTYIITISQ